MYACSCRKILIKVAMRIVWLQCEVFLNRWSFGLNSKVQQQEQSQLQRPALGLGWSMHRGSKTGARTWRRGGNFLEMSTASLHQDAKLVMLYFWWNHIFSSFLFLIITIFKSFFLTSLKIHQLQHFEFRCQVRPRSYPDNYWRMMP